MSDEYDLNKIMADIEPEKESPKQSEDDVKPLPHEEGWTDYILSFLSQDEVYVTDSGSKHPTVAGLRRVVSRFYNIISSTSKVQSIYVAFPDDKYPTSTVEHTLVVAPKDVVNGVHTVWSGCGTVGPWNQGKGDFSFPTECAETKAKGRAYVNLLGLKTCTKDEIGSSLTTKISDKITAAQIKKFITLCDTIGVDVNKYIGTRKYKKIEDVSSNDFWDMLNGLNKLQQKTHNKDMNEKEQAFFETIKK